MERGVQVVEGQVHRRRSRRHFVSVGRPRRSTQPLQEQIELMGGERIFHYWLLPQAGMGHQRHEALIGSVNLGLKN
jgi:hypothetical protein